MSDPEETMRHAADALRAEISGVLGEEAGCEHGAAAGTYCWPCAQRDRGIELRAYASPAPSAAPRVFLPGDTVPAGVATMCEPRTVVPAHHSPWKVAIGAYVEVHGVPSPEAWHATVDRARAEREES